MTQVCECCGSTMTPVWSDADQAWDCPECWAIIAIDEENEVEDLDEPVCNEVDAPDGSIASLLNKAHVK